MPHPELSAWSMQYPQQYCVKLGDKPLLSCAICGQGSHDVCILSHIGIPPENNSTGAEDITNKLNPTGFTGFHYICGGCIKSSIPDKEVDLLKRKSVSAQDGNQQQSSHEADEPHEPDESIFPLTQTTQEEVGPTLMMDHQSATHSPQTSLLLDNKDPIGDNTPRNTTPNPLAKPLASSTRKACAAMVSAERVAPITTLIPVRSLYSLEIVDPMDMTDETVLSFIPGCVNNLSPPVNTSPLIALCVMSRAPNGQHQRIPALLKKKIPTAKQGTQDF